VLSYTASHADLIAAFGTDQGAALAHYIAQGHAEGRATTFDAAQYLENYADADLFAQVGVARGRRPGRAMDRAVARPQTFTR
jgi:hypothetical protein